MHDERMPTEEILQTLSEMVAMVIISEAKGDLDDIRDIILDFGNMLVANITTCLIAPEGEALN